MTGAASEGVSQRGRRGARSYATITSDIKEHLEHGLGESVTHVEQMALHFPTLMSVALPGVTDSQGTLEVGGFVARMRTAGALIWAHGGWHTVELAAVSPSDTVRGWAAFAVACAPLDDPDERVSALLRFADDAHFAVREWAWLSLRPAVVTDTQSYVRALEPLTRAESPRVRRFAVEATRPRSVWGAHLPDLMTAPALGRRLLDAVAADDERYVQDATANWLNDVARLHPTWVRGVCSQWQSHHGEAVSRLTRRALRSLKAGPPPNGPGC